MASEVLVLVATPKELAWPNLSIVWWSVRSAGV